MKKYYDYLDGWREDVGIKNSKGEVKRYEGDSEYDPTAEAIKANIREEERRKKEQEQELER